MVTDDELASLMTKDAAARITVNVGFGEDYGKLKCGVSISLTCDQNDPMIERAKKAAFERALVFADEGMKMIVAELEKTAAAP